MYMESSDKNLTLHESEILRYLGYRRQKIPQNIIDKILGVKKECEDFFTPKYIYEEYNLNKREDGIELIGTNLILKGNDIYNLLKECDRCILMAVTIGNNVERRTRFYEKVDLTKGLIFDACATTCVEEVCDLLEEEIKAKYISEDEELTFRSMTKCAEYLAEKYNKTSESIRYKLKARRHHIFDYDIFYEM